MGKTQKGFCPMRRDKICKYCTHRKLDPEKGQIVCEKGQDMEGEGYCIEYEGGNNAREDSKRV